MHAHVYYQLLHDMWSVVNTEDRTCRHVVHRVHGAAFDAALLDYAQQRTRALGLSDDPGVRGLPAYSRLHLVSGNDALLPTGANPAGAYAGLLLVRDMTIYVVDRGEQEQPDVYIDRASAYIDAIDVANMFGVPVEDVTRVRHHTDNQLYMSDDLIDAVMERHVDAWVRSTPGRFTLFGAIAPYIGSR